MPAPALQQTHSLPEKIEPKAILPGRVMGIFLIGSILLSSCTTRENPFPIFLPIATEAPAQPENDVQVTRPPARPVYEPGELVDYLAQSGDTLPALAMHFNTTEKEIRAANPVIPNEVTTLPPGFPMKIPIYYKALWGSSFQILPDALFVFGPADRGFDTAAFVDSQPGWLKNYSIYAGGEDRRGGAMIDYLATNFSVSPRLLLALLDYQLGALSNPQMPDGLEDSYPLGYREHMHRGLYQQLLWAVNTLNNAYYNWRKGTLPEFEHPDGRLERPDPWQNAASVAIQYYYSRFMQEKDYLKATHTEGLLKTYEAFFGPAWQGIEPLIPGSLQQPDLLLPFQQGKAWAFTGGPHTGWGEGEPFSALDFAPPAVVGGCSETQEFATALAEGTIVRKSTAIAVLDLDSDGDERTGWVVFYLHLATDSIPPQGTHLEAGQPIGKPSCEGGRATGTHVHIARKYNGEWILADGPLAFNLEGWIAQCGDLPYQGTLIRFSRTVRACDCSDQASQIQSGSLMP